jgi:hypothetical protein
MDELEDEAENIALGRFLTTRLQQSSGETIPGDDFTRELSLAEEARSLAEDPADAAEVRAVREDMDALSPDWPE